MFILLNYCVHVIFVNRSNHGVFYFGHAESFIPVLAALGLFHDREPLRADTFNTPSLAEARKFRTSAFAPFSANLAFVLYDCVDGRGTGTRKGRVDVVDRLFAGGGDNFVANISVSNRFFVQLVINERPVKFPSSLCGRSICSYSKLREFYSPYIDRCHFHEKCEIQRET